MKAIVTVKLSNNPVHDPRHKKSGRCPLNGTRCTDVTGSHHSYIETGETLKKIEEIAEKKWGHVTRIEVIEEGS